jgi:hypothetical protein
VYVWQKVDTAAQPVAGATSGKTVRATLVNSSNQPVYDVKIEWMVDGVLRYPSFREEPLKPDEEHPATADADWDIDPMAIAFFRDRAGALWRTYADGRLKPNEDSATPAQAAKPGLS